MSLISHSSHRIIDSAPQRMATVSVVLAIHAVILYAFLTALGVVPMPTIPMPFIGTLIPDDRPIPLPPPPIQPVIEAPRLNDTALPIIELPLAPEGAGAITLPQLPQQATPGRQATPEPQAPQSPSIVMTPARAIAWTHTIPEYPPLSRRLGEQGTLRLKLVIAADGTVGEAQVETSSGHQRLDEAAVQWVKAHWRYEPAMQGLSPVASSAFALVTFKLK